MPIPFTCPHCGVFSQVADHFAGITGPCAQCGKQITIPAATVTAPSRGPAPKGRSGSSILFWIVVAVAGFFMFVVCAGVLLALLLPAINAAREAARRAACTNNLQQLAQALDNYHIDYGLYPPATIAGADGAPMHSWRALLLRYFDEDLADQYDFNEPWNSPKNQQLANQMPPVFACSDNPESMRGITSYVALVGPGFLFTGQQPTRRSQIPNPTTTIAVVEVADHVQINWLEPRDMTVDEASPTIGDRDRPSISSNHVHGAQVLMADGSVEFFADDRVSWRNPSGPAAVQ